MVPVRAKTACSFHHSLYPVLLLRVKFCSEAKRMKTLPLATSCINRDTVTNASFYMREFLTAFNFVRYQEISQILHSGITLVQVDYQSDSLNQQV